MTLEQAVILAKDKSIAALQAATKKENSYWRWKVYLSDYKPQLALKGSLFDFNRAFQPVIQPDGNTLFQSISNNNTSPSLTMSQSLTATGTNFFLESQLNRFTDFDNDITRYNGSPLIIGLNQPLFQFNKLKWNKTIEPLLYEESKKSYTADMENIARQTATYFFSLLEAQVRYSTATINCNNADTLLSIGEERYAQGNIFKNDLLQLKLALKNAEQTQRQAEVDLENASQALSAFIGMPQESRWRLDIPNSPPIFKLDEKEALEQARLNRPEIIRFERQKKESEKTLAQAKSDRGLRADLFATFGLNNRSNSFQDLYRSPTDRQTFRLGFNIPVIDWGRAKAKVQEALANQKLVEYIVEQEEIKFVQQVSSQVRQLRSLREQLKIAEESNEITQERYQLTKNRYLNGGIDITSLNIALQEKDRATNDLIAVLKKFWLAYYSLRALTLYDFGQNQPLGK